MDREEEQLELVNTVVNCESDEHSVSTEKEQTQKLEGVRESEAETSVDESKKEGKEDDVFAIFLREKVVKVDACTYLLGKPSVWFYLCSCQGINFYPICEECIKKCHKDHTYSKHRGSHPCKCGEYKHEVPPESRQPVQKGCLWDHFSAIHKRDLKQINDSDIHICSECINNKCILAKDISNEDFIEVAEDSDQKCACTDHPQLNIYELTKIYDTIKNTIKTGNNFNMNLLIQCPEIKQISWDDLLNLILLNEIRNNWQAIKDSITSKFEKKPYIFRCLPSDKNFIFDFDTMVTEMTRDMIENRQLLDQFFEELNNKIKIPENLSVIVNKDINQLCFEGKRFINFLKNMEESFFNNYRVYANLTFFKDITYSSKFKGISFDNTDLIAKLNKKTEEDTRSYLIDMLKLDDYKTATNKSSYLTNKIYFAYFIFHLFFKRDIIDLNPNNLPFFSLLNMDVYQRFIYIQKSKEFINFKDASLNNVEQKLLAEHLDSLISHIREILIKLKDESELISSVPLQLINKIYKKLIKRNLLEDDVRRRYLTTLDELIKECQESKISILNPTENFSLIMKIIFYSLLNKNDRAFYAKFGKATKRKNNQLYAFEKNDESEILCSIFLKNITNFINPDSETSKETKEREEAYEKSKFCLNEKIQVYITKIFHLIAGDSSFYDLNIKNIKYMDNYIFNLFKNEPEETFHSKLVTYLNSLELDKNYFERFNEFSYKLLENNRKYFNYKYRMPKDEGVETSFEKEDYFLDFYKLWNEITTRIDDWIPLTMKYNAIKSKGADDEGEKKIRVIRESIKYTPFYQAINGFLYIFSESTSIAEPWLSESISFLLYFLFLLIKDDPQNLVLLTTLNPENMITTFLHFEDCAKYFYCFVENITDAFYRNLSTHSYQYDNNNFFANLILCLNKRIVLDDDLYDKDRKSVTGKELKKQYDRHLNNYLFLAYSMKLTRKMLRELKIQSQNILKVVRNMLETIRKVKGPKFIECLNQYLEFNSNEDEKLSEQMGRVLRNYLLFMNDLMMTEVPMFHDCLKEDYFWFTLEDLHDKTKSIHSKNSSKNLEKGSNMDPKESDMPIMIKLLLMEHYDKRFIYPTYSCDQHFKSLKQAISSENHLIPRVHLKYEGIHEDHIEDHSTFFEHFNVKANHFIENRLKNAVSLIQSAYLIKDLVKRRIVIFIFFENAIVRPTYFIINQYLQNLDKMTGTESNYVYLIANKFLEITKQFLEHIRKTDIMKDKDEDKKLFKSLNLFAMENIHIKFPFDSNYDEENNKVHMEMNKNIDYDMKTLQELNYYQINEIVNIFRKNLAAIMKSDDEMLKFENYEKKDDHSKESQKFKEEHAKQHYVKDMYKEYQKKVTAFPHNDAICQVINKSEYEDFSNYSDSLINFLFANLYHNFKKKNYMKAYIYFKIFNNFFLRFSSIVQEKLEFYFTHQKNENRTKSEGLPKLPSLEALYGRKWDEDENIGTNFIRNLFKEIIYPTTILQSKKLNELKFISHHPSITMENTKAILKFIQNLCEDHNSMFQKILFNLHIYDPEEDNKEEWSKALQAYENFEKKIIDKRLFFYLHNPIKAAAETQNPDLIDLKPENENKEKDGSEDEKIEDEEKVEINTEEAEKKETEEKVETKETDHLLSYLRKHIIDFYLQQDKDKEKKGEEKKDEKEEKDNILNVYTLANFIEVGELEASKFSLLNFSIKNLKMLLYNCRFSASDQNILYANKDFRNIQPVIDLNKRFTDLLIEMMQNPDGSYNQHFFRKVSFDNAEMDQKTKYEKLSKNFYFLEYLREIRNTFNEEKDLIDPELIQIKLSMMSIFNNLIKQDRKENNEIIKVILDYFPLNHLMHTVQIYTVMLYYKYVKKIDKDEEVIEKIKGFHDEDIFNFKLVMEMSKSLEDCYDIANKNGKYMYNDPLFQLPSSIFIFLVRVSEQYKNEDVRQLFSKNEIRLFGGVIDEKVVKGFGNWELGAHLCGSFYASLIRKCEFLMKKEESEEESESKEAKKGDGDKPEEDEEESKVEEEVNNEGIDLNQNEQLKIIYFYRDPRSKLVDHNNSTVKNFFDKVNRTSATTKLKGFTEELDRFYSEVVFQEKMSAKNNNSVKWKKYISYGYFKTADFINFSISFLINLILLLFFENGTLDSKIYLITLIFSLIQIGINVYYLVIFFKYKFEYLISLEKEQQESENKMESIFTDMVFYLKKAMNSEIALIYFNLLIPFLYIFSSYAVVLFPLQLFTAVKFVDTIKSIFQAFEMTFNQIISMIAFLAILILFYSNIGFFFMTDQFNLTLGDGTTENVCNSLLSCFILYFNFGIRSGGGIGDVIGPVPYSSYWYWIRWVTDMIFYITVILLIMNMINGIIISTFGAIREDNEKKEDDRDNKCFICSLPKVIFENNKISFQNHRDNEHNPHHYIEYFITLKFIFQKDLDHDESYILEQLSAKEISVFPVEQTSATLDKGVSDKDKDD